MPPRQRHLIQLGAGLLLALTVLGIGALVAWSDQPSVRYASLRCVYRKIYNERGPVDVVVVGTSRTKWGVSPQEVGVSMRRGGKPVTVLNLARSWRGTQQMFQEVKDVEAERGIRRAIVIEYSREGDIEATSQRYYDYYPDHAAAVTVGDFGDDPNLKPREPAYVRVRDLLDLYQQRVDYALDRAIGRKARFNREVPVAQRPVVGSAGCTGKDRPYKPGVNAAWVKRVVPPGGTWRDRLPVDWTFGELNNDAQRETMLQMVRWAHERHLGVYFILMPRLVDERPVPGYFSQFEGIFGAPLLFPPDGVLEELYAGDGYSDPNHLQRAGREIYSRWLGTQIR